MKIKITLLIIIAILVFCGASPWEGAAVTAPNGELPANGRYVATNSFPRNTVVDILNIETNRSTRVIVANALDSPGLLATVSREAAELIGMRPGSVIRIRMTQPSDPIAYLRFTEGLSAGITDYDSGNVITEENFREDTYGAETYREDTRRIYSPAEEASEAPPARRETAAPVVANGAPVIPGYVLEPEWSGGSSRGIIDLPEDITAEEPVYTAYPDDFDEPADEYTSELDTESEEYAAENIPEEAEEPQVEYAYADDSLVEEEAEPAAEDVIETAHAAPAEYNIVPAEERPPVYDIYGIDPASIIPGIKIAPSEPEFVPESVIETAVIVPQTYFTVPSISELDSGRYYVQIAAMDTPESVETAVNHIDRSYKPVVYKDGDKWYRILLGPLNQGESAAILQRFKSIGYKDAFVRHGK